MFFPGRQYDSPIEKWPVDLKCTQMQFQSIIKHLDIHGQGILPYRLVKISDL